LWLEKITATSSLRSKCKIRYVLLGNHVVGRSPEEARVNQVGYDDYTGSLERLNI